MDLVFECLTTGPFQENSWIAGDRDSGDAILTDPGVFEPAEADRLAQRLDALGLTPLAIVNTHAHIDHIAGVERVRERWPVPLYMHPGEKVWLENLAQQCALFGVPPIAAPRVDHWLEDGQRLDFGSLSLEVRHVPGHTPGGCALVFPGHVLAGDVLFAGSIGRTDFPGGDFDELARSIRERLYDLEEDTVVHSGHGPDTTIGRERTTNPFVRL